MVKSKKCYIALLLFSTMFLGLFVNSSGDASALDDISITYDSTSGSVYSGVQVFGSLLSSHEQTFEYSYLNITFNPFRVLPYNSLSNPDFIYVSVGCFKGFWGSPYFNTSYPITYVPGKSCNKVPTFYSAINFGNLLQPGESVTFTLSETSIFSTPPSSSPSGTLSITSNGTFNVSSYEYAEVDVPAPPVVTPYDGKLDSLIQAVYTIGAVMLVIYFFFALYRLYIGGKT